MSVDENGESAPTFPQKGGLIGLSAQDIGEHPRCTAGDPNGALDARVDGRDDVLRVRIGAMR